MKKPTVSSLKAKLDVIFGTYIKLRDKKKGCITCGSTQNIQCGHFMSRRYNSTRYDEKNCAGQCAKCNLWGHGEQYKFGQAIDERYGKGTADILKLRAQLLKKWTIQELQEKIEYYKNEIKKLEAK